MVRPISLATIVAAGLAAGIVGCGSPEAKFLRYEAYAHKTAQDAQVEFTADQRQNIDEVMQALFGTPDEPRLPALEDVEVAEVVNLSKLQLAAGPVGSDEAGNPRGLYREHCAHCHGITGDGAGPTAAFLNPYPRDYRKGWFKFKSTPIGVRPTHDDLKKIVLEGIPGTAMPSFKLLPDLEVEALVQYVKYLSMRGEVERALLRATASDLEEGQVLLPVLAEGATQEQTALQADQKIIINEAVTQVITNWIDAPTKVVEIPPRQTMTPEESAASRKRGQELFYGFAQCIKCHGDSALGDGQTTDFDEWTKEFIADGKNTDLIRTYESLGVLPPRNIQPRNLRLGVYRGGMRPIDLYWRIRNGIEGVPMPAVTMKPADDPHAKGVTPEDIWDIVNYVESLPFESVSNPLEAAAEAENPRERL